VNNPIAEIKAYPPGRRLCPITILKEYLKRTSRMRKTNKLFISYVKPYGAVTRSTISCWLKTHMSSAGIDIQNIQLTAFVRQLPQKLVCSVPVVNILNAVGWSSAKTFAKFYDKEIERNNFQETVLTC
jgi:hypothetical protein